jgi:hypothetical protein
MKESFTFDLTKKIIYTTGDMKLEAEYLSIKAPAIAQYKLINELEQLFVNCYKNSMEFFMRFQSKDVDKQENKELDRNTILTIIQMSSTDINIFLTKLRDLLTSNQSCLLDGKEVLTTYLYDQINRIDRNNLLGEYIANFTLPSWMQQH